MNRPGGGIGGAVWCSPDYYDLRSPRQTFAHWDAPFIRWLARNGYNAEFCTGLDLAEDNGIADNYRLLLTAGHDEYWSEPERDAVESFIGNGGNAAIFGGNTCWWRVRLVDDGAAMVCHQGGPDGARDHWWPPSGAARPEDMLCGTSYRHGGGWWDGARDTDGYIVQQSAHWVFAGTGLADGQAFGATTSPPLVGYECDGAPLAAFDPRSRRAVMPPRSEWRPPRRPALSCWPPASLVRGGKNYRSANRAPRAKASMPQQWDSIPTAAQSFAPAPPTGRRCLARCRNPASTSSHAM